MIRLPRRLGARFIVGFAIAVLPCSGAFASSEPPPRVSAHAEVVAQGIVAFPDGTFHWHVSERTLAATDDPTAVPDAVTFVLADAGVVDIDGGSRYRLATGEAAMLPASSGALLSTAGDSAEYWALSIGNAAQTGGVGATGSSFTLGAGPRDVNLIRDVLTTNEALAVPDQEVVTLVLVTGGAVTVVAEGNPTTEITIGDAVTIDGALTITNTSPDPATIVAAVITSTAVDSVPPAPASPPATGEPSPAPTTTAKATTTSAATTDTDGDGLSDADETGVYQTDPNSPDSEGDHVVDGDEVNVYGIDPLDNDSDDDFSTDGDEVNILGTDPANPDTDGDGLIDSNENPNGADPNNADTGDDGFGDGAEVAAGTNPADATSFP